MVVKGEKCVTCARLRQRSYHIQCGNGREQCSSSQHGVTTHRMGCSRWPKRPSFEPPPSPPSPPSMVGRGRGAQRRRRATACSGCKHVGVGQVHAQRVHLGGRQGARPEHGGEGRKSLVGLTAQIHPAANFVERPHTRRVSRGLPALGRHAASNLAYTHRLRFNAICAYRGSQPQPQPTHARKK